MRGASSVSGLNFHWQSRPTRPLCPSKCGSTQSAGGRTRRPDDTFTAPYTDQFNEQGGISYVTTGDLHQQARQPLRPHERISHIGGSGWKVTQAEGIANVKADPTAYYVTSAAGSVYLIVRQHNGNDYLTTEADGSTQNNLLSLPEC
jgi:Protein of unknown function (DUF3892)